MKAYGEKKNVWYCPKCKEKGHILSLTMKLKGVEYEEAKTLLTAKSLSYPATKIKEEINLNYRSGFQTGRIANFLFLASFIILIIAGFLVLVPVYP